MPIVIFTLILFTTIAFIYLLVKRVTVKPDSNNDGTRNLSIEEMETFMRKYDKSAQIDDPVYANQYHKEASEIHKQAQTKRDDEKLNLLTQCVSLYEQAARLSADNTEILRSWAAALVKLARLTNDDALYRESIQHLENADQLLPNNADIYCDLGEALDAYGSFSRDLQLMRRASDLLTQALSLSPPTAETHGLLAGVLFHIGMQTNDRKYFDECFDNYQKAVNLDPNDYWLYTNWADAIGYCGIVTNDASIYPQMIEKYYHAMDIEQTESEGIEILDDIRMVPSLFLEQLMRMLEVTSDDYLCQQCLEILTRIEKSITHPDVTYYVYWGYVLYTLAEIKADNELYLQSYERFEAAHSLDPNEDEHLIYWAMALTYHSAQSSNKALLTQARLKFEEAVRASSNPSDIYEQWGSALIYIANKQNDASLYKEGASMYGKAIDQYPELSFGYFRKAQCLIEEAMLNDNKYISTKSLETLLQKSLDMGYTYNNSQEVIYIYMLKLAAFVDDRSLFFTWMQKGVEEYGAEAVKKMLDSEDSKAFDAIKIDLRYQQLVNP